MLKTYNRLRVYIHNTSWSVGSKFLNIGAGFLVTVLVARYLGPEEFGVLSYAISLTAIFAAAGQMGLAGLVVREIVADPPRQTVVLGTVAWLKLAGMAVAFALLIAFSALYEGLETEEFLLLLILASALFFQPADVADYWFQAHLQERYTALARTGALLASSLAKVALVVGGAGLLALGVAHAAQAVIAAVLLFAFYKAVSGRTFTTWKFDAAEAKNLLKQGWLVYLGSILAVVNLKIDQVMLKWYIGSDEVGIYAVAAQLSEAWYFIPTAIVASFFPKLIQLKSSDPAAYHQRLQQLFDMLFLLAAATAVGVYLISTPLVKVFFGENYLKSAIILNVHIWAGIFVFMRALFSRWILIEHALAFSIITQGLGALTNIGVNMLLIPRFGGLGAAVATLFSYAMSSYLALLFHEKTRPVFYMMTKSMLIPVRYAVATLR
ncbi:flippase [Proteobacteria bacterium 005FR1]|nr:flippase [Proteobacteria bacterium 005FR1]